FSSRRRHTRWPRDWSSDVCSSDLNLSTATHFFNRVDSLITKLDYNFNTSNSLTGRYYFGDSNQSFPFAQLGGGLLPGFNTVTPRSEEHTSELQSRGHLVCRLLLEK